MTCKNDDSTPCKLKDNGSTIRLYDGKGNHKFSLLPCGINDTGEVTCVDLARPNGQVVYCGVDIELVNAILDEFGTEPIQT